MIRRFINSILATILIVGVTSCNSSTGDSPLATSDATVVVSSFSLGKNNKVLVGLDSVYFSINLQEGRIYNADSLPFGTNVSKLVPIIGTQGCKEATLKVRRDNQTDTIYNYLTNSTDTINFANGPVILHLVAADGVTSRDYSIEVNVHKMKPDSLYWNRTARRALPSSFSVPSRQKTVEQGNKLYCLTASSASYCLAETDNPSGDWTTSAVTFAFEPIVESLAATTDAFYMLDTQRILWRSTDCKSWVSTGEKMHGIIGAYGDKLLCIRSVNGQFNHVTYPATTSTPVAEGFPVEGFSPLVSITNEWVESPQVLMVGGRDAQGAVNGSTWGYDGSRWAKINNAGLPAGEGKTFVLYTTFKTDSTSWTTKAYPTLIAFGGRDAQGSLSRDVYVSINLGLSWKKGDTLVQLPSYVPSMADAQPFVRSTLLHASRAMSQWDEMASRNLPPWWAITPSSLSRVTTAVDSWECPYIYLFGGVNGDGVLYNTVWRAVINRLSFQPLY